MAAALDPPLRVLVEAGYDRTINPGQPTPAQWGYTPNLVKTAADLVRSVPTGWDDAIAVATDDPANRPFHTEPQGVYGVGGPPVYAGAIDPYAPVPPAAQPVAAQSDPMPSVATDDIMSSTPTLRAAHRSAPAPSRPHPAAVTAGRDHAPSPSSSKIATARVHPADAA